MQVRRTGIAEGSTMELVIPSSLAQETLYYVTGWGRFLCTGDYRVERCISKINRLILIVSGRLKVNAYGGNRFAGPGQIVLIGKGETYSCLCRENCEMIWIGCGGKTMASYLEFLLNRNAGPVFTPVDTERIRSLFDTITESVSSERNEQHAVSVHLEEIFAELARCSSKETHMINSGMLMRFMREHYSEQLMLSDLTGYSGMSQSYLIRSFRKDTGSTPHEYLLRYRLQRAMERLLQTDDSIEEISEACGFNSTSHFARAFKKMLNMTPSDFRKLQL